MVSVYGMYVLPFILIIAVPVNLLSHYITYRITKSSSLIHFLIHTVTAFSAGLLFFQSVSMGFNTSLVGIFVFAADIWLQKRPIGKPVKILLILLPLTVAIGLFIPNVLNYMEFESIKKKEQPVVHLTVGEHNTTIKHPTTCWDNDDSNGCAIPDTPYLIHQDPVSAHVFPVKAAPQIQVDLSPVEEPFDMQVFFLNKGTVQEMKVDGGHVTLPNSLKAQVVRVTATLSDSRKVSFSFGIQKESHSRTVEQ
ncbi:hypothetical protein Q7A53_10870 [Halobacillus rhizosphaerae]|uniref:hypothetical protein n=1 Tax=Halobacillus rhizosphaerae TaxID=3064889 RepID=UPI00398B5E37